MVAVPRIPEVDPNFVFEMQWPNNVCINVVETFYKNTTSCIKTDNTYAEEFIVNKGTRQGCCISLNTFKIYLYTALKNLTRKCARLGV